MTENGSEWLEISGNNVSWLGATEMLYPEQVKRLSLSSHLLMQLRQNGSVIEGKINHAGKRFVLPHHDDSLTQAPGRWFCPE
ncbi:MAG: hypothetical protein ACSLEN_05335 [Candidatus Malihini olakiniferum]